MSVLRQGAWAALLSLGWCGAGAEAAAGAADGAPAALSFRIDEGRNINSFVREGAVAAHLLLRAGGEPRILVAFPAGNSGVGLWFAHAAAPVEWTLLSPPRPVTLADARQRALRGIEFEVEVSAREMRFRGAVLSSVRVLRDYELLAKAPPEVVVDPTVTGATITWARDRLDGQPGYLLAIEAVRGSIDERGLRADDGRLRLRIRALTGEAPLTPLPPMLTADAGDDARAREALAFLSYREKLLAGSWRFDTYFGRDTLISALLLAAVLQPAAMESAVSSVLDRLAPDGEVAHEEDIGEFAVLRNAREGRGRVDTPIYDYGMVDDDFLLAPLAARWLLDDVRGRALAGEFLASRGASGTPRGTLLVRNVAWVVERTRAFARDPRAGNLVGIKAGRMTGNWRDSEQGLGRGRYAFDINAALVPAALDAAARLRASGLLEPYLDEAQGRTLDEAGAAAATWTRRAPDLFVTRIPPDRARAAIAAYAREVGVDASPAKRVDGPLIFHALSLDEAGRPVPILNSDEGFRLLLTDPPPDELARTLATVSRPFPAGLLTDAGLLVANPAHAEPALRREFTRFAYHGTVVWSWQQALMAAGLERQLRRGDLSTGQRAVLEHARRDLWSAIDRTRTLRTSELWSWRFAEGRFHAEAFGRPQAGGSADADESNAAQLWSTVFLGLRPPRLPSPSD